VDLLKDVYVSIESLRNSYGMIMDHIGEWIAQHTDFVADEELPPQRDLELLWTTLGVDPVIVEELAPTLRLNV